VGNGSKKCANIGPSYGEGIGSYRLSGNAAAREDPLALARDLKDGAVMPLDRLVSLSSSTSTDTRSTRCRSPMFDQMRFLMLRE
jgi:hypothetical protein